jgi:hypothetical protein
VVSIQFHEEAVVSLNRAQLIKALGDVNDAVIAEVVSMGATAEELAEAQAWIANDEALMNDGKPLAGGRAARLTEILIAVEEEKHADPGRT